MFVDLKLTEIRPNPDQPRRHFDDAALTELATSIKTNGLLEPVIVRPKDGAYELIAGERRWRASHRAGLETVPARIIDLGDEEAFVLSVAENVNREDMNPMEEAHAFQRLITFGRTLDEVAELFGKTTRYLTVRLDLLKLSGEFQRLVAAGTIGTRVAQQVALCNAANQQSMMFKLMRGDFASDNDAIHFAYALRQAEAQESMFDVAEPTAAERQQRTKARKVALNLLARTERAAAAIADLAELSPSELADAFTTDAETFMQRLDYLNTQIKKARFAARQGKALAEARTLNQIGAVTA